MINLTPAMWLILFVVLAVYELITVGLVSIWFAIGALVAMFVDLAGFGFWPQIISFLAVSILTMLLTRPFAVKTINQRKPKTNTDELKDQEAIVIEEINNLKGTGRVMLKGMDWRAVTENAEEIIPVEAKVIVRYISGVKVVVEKKEEK